MPDGNRPVGNQLDGDRPISDILRDENGAQRCGPKYGRCGNGLCCSLLQECSDGGNFNNDECYRCAVGIRPCYGEDWIQYMAVASALTRNVLSTTRDLMSTTQDVISKTRDLISPQNLVSTTRDLMSTTQDVISKTRHLISTTQNVVSKTRDFMSPQNVMSTARDLVLSTTRNLVSTITQINLI